MIVVAVAEPLHDPSYVPLQLPYHEPVVLEGPRRSLYVAPGPEQQTPPIGYAAPITYVLRKTRTVSAFRIVNDQFVVVEENQTDFRIVKIYPPMMQGYPLIAVGAKGEIQEAINLFCQARGDTRPSYRLARFDLDAIATSYPDDHWFWDFKANSDYVTSGKLHGERIELSHLVDSVRKSSAPHEVGIMLRCGSAQLKVRILGEGRVQFWQFHESHLQSHSHPQLGDPWPLIVQAVQTLLRFKL